MTGFTVAPGDVEALRERLERVLGDEAVARRLGANGRQRVLERLTWDACAERCLTVYAELGVR